MAQLLRKKSLLMEPAEHRVELPALVRHSETAAVRMAGVDLQLDIAVVDAMPRQVLAQSKQDAELGVK